MFNKKRIVAILAGVALLLGVTGTAGIVADTVGLSVTSPAHACPSNGSSGGGC